MAINRKKYENAILYYLNEVNNIHLGKVKLMKLLYYLDFDHFEKYGSSITRDTYRNKEAGPVPDSANMIINEMEAKELINIHLEQVIDFLKYRYTPHKATDLKVFKPTEFEMLCEIAKKWEHHSTNEIVNASHGEAPWIATRENEEIPYALAYYRNKFNEPDSDADEIPVTPATSDTQNS